MEPAPLRSVDARACNFAGERRMRMGVQQAPTAKGKASAKGLQKAAAENERKTEAETGKPLDKGAKRFDERSKSSDGKSAGAKQK
jgi:hypothetical protein